MKIPTEVVILFNIGEEELNITQIAKRAGMTYAQIHRLIKNLENKGMIETYKERKERLVKITPKGLEAREHYRDFLIAWNT